MTSFTSYSDAWDVADPIVQRLSALIDAKINLAICEHVHNNADGNDTLKVSDAEEALRSEIIYTLTGDETWKPK